MRTEPQAPREVRFRFSFVDNYALTGGSPTYARFYRVRLVYP
jgi:hypothetical protein